MTRFTTEEELCPYLHDRPSAMEYRVVLELSPPEWEAMLARGWRRFGPVYFRPVCRTCMGCVSLRIPVARHVPSKSQRRVLRKAARFRVKMGRPICDADRLHLYQLWHADRERERGWKPNPLTPVQYEREFCFPHSTGQEMAWYDGDTLVAVDLVDVTPHALSSIFFFYDPAYASFSPGIASVLLEVAWAKHHGLDHVYLGYRVEGCASMDYKGIFRPYELLRDRPNPEEEPQWMVESTESGN